MKAFSCPAFFLSQSRPFWHRSVLTCSCSLTVPIMSVYREDMTVQMSRGPANWNCTNLWYVGGGRVVSIPSVYALLEFTGLYTSKCERGTPTSLHLVVLLGDFWAHKLVNIREKIFLIIVEAQRYEKPLVVCFFKYVVKWVKRFSLSKYVDTYNSQS